MNSYDNLSEELLRASLHGELDNRVAELRESGQCNEAELDALLHPRGLPAVVKLPGDCDCGEPSDCQLDCLFSAIHRDESGKIVVAMEDCTGCGDCIAHCECGLLKERKDLIPLFEALNEGRRPVFAMVAPAFLGQFSPEVTVGRLRNAFKKLRFHGMVEVALFADILTLKEALEYDRLVKNDEDFLLTSCCCPMWVAMIRKVYANLSTRIPPSVSPMVACGRAVKKLHPDALTVFVGPCLAKKAEAREPDIADAVDYVVTFKEVESILQIAGIDLDTLEDDRRDHSSAAGRIYARTGGVSLAVERTLERLKGHSGVPFTARQADGVKACRAMLEEAAAGRPGASFLEGMGCVHGCVGGPRVMIDPAEGEAHVNDYADAAALKTPVDNPYIYALMARLGYDSVEALLVNEGMFTREF